MSSDSGRSERFLRELEARLAQLGPREAEDTVGEVRSHLEDAATEPGGVEAALSEFGSPDQLAASILRERGLLAEEPKVPDAPAWRRGLAWLIDACIAGVLVIWIATWVIGTALSPVRTMPDVMRETFIYGAVWLALALLWAVMYWGNRAPAASRPSWGLVLTGLRRVGVKGGVRTVRASAVDIVRPRLGYVLGGVVALALVGMTVAGAAQSAASNARVTQEQSTALVADAAAWDTSGFTQTASVAVLAALDEAQGREAAWPQTSRPSAVSELESLAQDARLLHATTWEFLNCTDLVYVSQDVERQKADAEADVTFTLWGADARGVRQGRTWTMHLTKTVTTDEHGATLEQATTWSTLYAVDGLRAEPATISAVP